MKNKIEEFIGKIINDDCMKIMKNMPDECIDLTITSPPYDDLRDYENNLVWNNNVFKEVANDLFRVTKKGGVVVWVIGDKTTKGNKSLTSFKHALYFQEIGFNIYDVIIYEKAGSGPPHPNRYFNTFEYMFILSKGKPKTVNLLRDKKNSCAGMSTFGNITRREKDGSLVNKGKKIINEFGVRTNIWRYNNGKGFSSKDKIAYEHPATFPEKLVEDHINSWTNIGDIVFDPFGGSGTTAKVSMQLKRRWIYIEKVEKYCTIAKKRIATIDQNTDYKTIIIKNNIDITLQKLNDNYLNLSETGNIFCIVKTQYKDGVVEKDFFDVIDFATKKLGLYYINTIIIPEETDYTDNILYCVWFVKNKENFYFNKDKIREKSIWKDVEWGKRTKNYNPKGKDPGNVWIPTIDDGKANITKHILLSVEEIFNRIFNATLIENDKYLLILDNNKLKNYKYNDNGNIEIIREVYKDINFGKTTTTKLKDESEVKVIFNTSESMDLIKNEKVDLIVTSPPYWDLKNYYKKNQIGQESYDIYSSRMKLVWQECYNKLNSYGSIWININIRVRDGKPILLPKLFIDQCKNLGFLYRGILIWHKSSGIPTNSKNLSDHHEYILIFTKSDKCKINIGNLILYNDYKNSKISNKLIWNINRKAGSVGKNTIHPAIFPTELINRIVVTSSNENDIVLDPFLGSGTSLIASVNNKRNFIGYEYNEGFKSLMQERFAKEIKFKDVNIEYLENIVY